jgi:hypothetical protein
MTEFFEQDLSGASFRRVSLRKASFRDVYLTDARLQDVDLSGASLRGALLEGCRMRGVELVDVEISGETRGVVVNGVDIGPLVEAELDRRMPERRLMRPDDAEGFRKGWETIVRLWSATEARARTFPEEVLHLSVDDEWSFIETLRHLGFATATWVAGLVLRDESPWHPLDLPWDEAPDWEGVPRDRDVRPTLDEVLAVRRARQTLVGELLAGLTDEQLGTVLPSGVPGWPLVESATVQEALRVVLNEEWEHRLYAERDLTVIETMIETGMEKEG